MDNPKTSLPSKEGAPIAPIVSHIPTASEVHDMACTPVIHSTWREPLTPVGSPAPQIEEVIIGDISHIGSEVHPLSFQPTNHRQGSSWT